MGQATSPAPVSIRLINYPPKMSAKALASAGIAATRMTGCEVKLRSTGICLQPQDRQRYFFQNSDGLIYGSLNGIATRFVAVITKPFPNVLLNFSPKIRIVATII